MVLSGGRGMGDGRAEVRRGDSRRSKGGGLIEDNECRIRIRFKVQVQVQVQVQVSSAGAFGECEVRSWLDGGSGGKWACDGWVRGPGWKE